MAVARKAAKADRPGRAAPSAERESGRLHRKHRTKERLSEVKHKRTCLARVNSVSQL